MSTSLLNQGWSRKRRIVFLIAMLVVCVGLDHATKWLAIQYLKGHPPLIYLGDLFRLQYATNTGAFLSLGSQLPESVREYILSGLNGFILLMIGVLLIFRERLRAGVVLALSLILSGGVGNLIDRVFRDGVVIDFMNMGIPWGPMQIRTGIFNIADIAIMAGLFLMIGIEFFMPDPDDAKTKTESATGEGKS